MNQEQKEQIERCLKICENNFKKAINLIENKRQNFLTYCKLNALYEETIETIHKLELTI